MDTGTNPKRRRSAIAAALATCVASLGAVAPRQGEKGSPKPASLEETRVVLSKWIETQQILSKERNEWQQGREILTGRLDLLRREIAGLEEKIKAAETSAVETEAKRETLLAQKSELDASIAQLAGAVTGMEGDVRKLCQSVPDPVRTKLDPLRQRIPEDPATTKVTAAERFQNVLGILDELNKANNELAVTYEVRDLADGKPSEVRVLYVGLAQAYYVSAGGQAGIGRPGANGWTWEPSQAIAGDVLLALDIVQAKQSPAFVPLPVKLQ